jgi:hypothetical protein
LQPSTPDKKVIDWDKRWSICVLLVILMFSIADDAITGREGYCKSPSQRSLKPPIRADCVRGSWTKLSAQLLPLQGQLFWCAASSCSAKASPAFATNRTYKEKFHS